MKALSIRQPWAWLIVNGFKPYENRTWTTKFRGPLLIHAGKAFDRKGYDWVRSTFPEIDMPSSDQFERGGIVGAAELWEVATASSSPWFSGPYGFCLAKATPLPFMPLAGKLGFFEVGDDAAGKRGRMTEPTIRINGILLTDGQAMTLRVACNDFYSRMSNEGLGDDEMGQQLTAAYLKQAAAIIRLMHGESEPT